MFALPASGMYPWVLPARASASSDQAIGITFADLEIKNVFERSFRITNAMLQGFGDVTGDRNPVHFDDLAAKRAGFRKRIAHGLLTGSLVSQVFGMDFPGPGAIYKCQSFEFERPVYIDDEVRVRVEVVDKKIENGKQFVTFTCLWTVKGKPVITGEATIYMPK